MATLYKPDGITTQITPGNGKTFTLEELQEIVRGYIQLIAMFNRRCAIVDEDGRMKQLPVNLSGTRAVAGRTLHNVSCSLVGNVLVCEEGEVE